MVRILLHLVGVMASVVALGASPSWNGQHEDAHIRFIEIVGLKSTYPSCARVDFSIRNTSKQDISVEVYVEKLESSSWNNEAYPYAINDPGSLYRKTVRADVIKPDASLKLSYDRCLKPRFIEEDDEAFKRGISDEDEKAKGGATQRFRVDIRAHGQDKVTQKEWSQPFSRASEKK